MNSPANPPSPVRTSPSASDRIRRGLGTTIASAFFLVAAFLAYVIFAIFSAIFLSADVGQRHAALMKSVDPIAHSAAIFLTIICILAILRAFSAAPRLISRTWLLLSCAIGIVAIVVARQVS